MLRAGLLALLVTAFVLPGAAAPMGMVEIDMSPHEPASFGLRNVAAGATAVLGGWNYWYKERLVEVETVPADAQLHPAGSRPRRRTRSRSASRRTATRRRR
jgi:hypothetical protein